MNVSELARRLKISPQELLDKLPLMGFHIGQRAIKVDNVMANKIINQWPMLLKRFEAAKFHEAKREAERIEIASRNLEITIPNFITVRELAALANLPVNKVLAELIKNGIFASLNEKVDFETASIIGSDLGFEAKLADGSQDESGNQAQRITDIIEKQGEANIDRAPVIVVMGHVDHGKTRLLDTIRKTNVVESEAGGITQHIGAYQIVRNDKPITFIDTPGHEAFTAMRSRGARIADIAILVVAADDGVKPQTVEAFRIIEAAKIPYIVAINKIDKPDADIMKTKQELSTQLGITPEDWGGKTVCALVSAKEGQGIEELLDIILLTAEMEAGNIKADPNVQAVGTVIESHLSKGEGPVATVLVQNGTLRAGDHLVFAGQAYGKVRTLKNFRGESIVEAGPSTPVKIIGLKVAPVVGDILEVGEGEKVNLRNLKTSQTKQESSNTNIAESDTIKKINLIVKSDVLGSAEAIVESLEKINTAEIRANIIIKGLGNITDSDIERAQAANAKILGFNVKATPRAEYIAREKGVTIKLYRIIYDLINDIKAEMQGMIAPEIRRVDLGKMKVKAIFRTDNKEQIVGGVVTEGELQKDSLIELERDGLIIETGKLLSLQAGKQEVTSVEIGQECGIKYQGQPLKVDDILHFYKEEKIIKKL